MCFDCLVILLKIFTYAVVFPSFVVWLSFKLNDKLDGDE